MKYVVLVSHKKGGVGKSTVSLNLAAGLNRAGIATAVLDLDRSSATSSSARDAASAIRVEAPDYATTLPDVYSFFADPDVVASRNLIDRDNHLRRIVRALQEKYEVLVLDAGAGDQEDNALATAIANLLIIPFPCDPGDVTSTIEFVSTMDRYVRERGSPLVIRTLVNRYLPARRASAVVEERTSDPTWSAPAFRTRIPSGVRIPEQTLEGRTVFDLPTGDDASAAFSELASEVISIMEASRVS